MFNSYSDTLDRSTLLLRRLHLLVDLRKRNAFDFLASLPDLDLYGPRSGAKGFDDGDLHLEDNTGWSDQMSRFKGESSDEEDEGIIN